MPILPSLVSNTFSGAVTLDGGVTDDGQPYLVMEVVNGVALDRHCEDGALALEDRLRLFVRACEAVQHAHGNLVVHCDLKPDNILITDEGELKLLDFGIATAIGGDDQRQGALAMTPTYAAPELFDGEGVTTAADVYSRMAGFKGADPAPDLADVIDALLER